MSETIEICEECMDLRIADSGRESVLRHLAGLLEQRGCVDAVYADKIVEREASYPTGIQFADISIALPHGDAAYVQSSAIAVGKCGGRPLFRSMEDPDKEIPVDLVVLLAVRNPDEHLMVLNNLMHMFTSAGTCRALLETEDCADVCRLFRQALYQEKSRRK